MSEYWSAAQLENIAFFENHLNEYLNNQLYKDKFLVIHTMEVKGIFDTFDAALNFALTSGFSKEEFIIQQVVNEKEIVSFIRSAV